MFILKFELLTIACVESLKMSVKKNPPFRNSGRFAKILRYVSFLFRIYGLIRQLD